MELTAIGGKVLEFLKKYRYVVLVLLIGVGLMVIPGKTSNETEPMPSENSQETAIDQSEQLEDILSQIDGAGKVKVLLTWSSGPRTVYQTDDDCTTTEGSSTVHRDTVVITDADRAEQGLVTQVLSPEYLGAVVICQGADSAAVRLSIVEAVADATGLGTDQISVLKMK